MTVTEPIKPAVAAVFDSPHSGTDYPADFNAVLNRQILRQAEDTFVDELFAQAPEFGITLLQAHFPRSYIDPNRSCLDLDPSLLAEPWPDRIEPGQKVELGCGLIWRNCPPDEAIYDRLLSLDAVRNRITGYYQPYHDALTELLDQTWDKFGRVYHVNCHSMPSLSNPQSPEGPGHRRPDFALGDQDGKTCAAEFTELVRETMAAMGYDVRVNDPYKGAELVRVYSNPEQGRHSLQIEISRALYMDEARFEKSNGFETLQRNLIKLMEVVGDFATDAPR